MTCRRKCKEFHHLLQFRGFPQHNAGVSQDSLLSSSFKNVIFLTNDNLSISADKIGLSRSSSFFKDLFSDKSEDEIHVIVDCRYEVLHLVLETIYTGQCSVSSNQVASVLGILKLFSIDNVISDNYNEPLKNDVKEIWKEEPFSDDDDDHVEHENEVHTPEPSKFSRKRKRDDSDNDEDWAPDADEEDETCFSVISFKKKHTQRTNINTTESPIKNKPHECKICEKSFREKYDLKVHINTKLHKKRVLESDGSIPEPTVENQNQIILDIRDEETVRRAIANIGKCSEKKERSSGQVICPVCGGSYKGKWKLDRHIRTAHQDKVELIKCDLCDFSSKNPEEMEKHITSLHPEVCSSCEICGKVFSTAKALERHTIANHERKDCELCNITFKQVRQLQEHMASVHELYHYCDKCDFKSATKYQLADHKRFKHERGKEIECNQCDSKFNWNAALQLHIKMVHEKARYKCEICGYTNSNNHSVKEHILVIHAGQKFVCKECGQSFDSRARLVTHKVNVHDPKEKISVKCDQCDNIYNRRSAMLRHKRKCH